jgi:adenylate cyclase
LRQILAADVAGYSRLMAADEAGTLARLRRLRAEVFEPKISQFHGRIVGSAGDSLLVEFASAVNAVEYAIEVQETLAGQNASLPENRRMVFRMGVNLGDVIAEDDTIHGDGVNIAARLEKLSEPGGVCIGRAIYDQVKGKLACAYEDLGEQRFHNIAELVRVYRVKPAKGSADRSPGSPAKDPLPLPDKPSIAVLPFQNLSADPEQEHFADGITEDIITQLSRLRDLLVIARNSTFVFKGRAVPVQQVARDLGVRYVLEGSVRRAGNRIRVTAQLIDATTGGHVWAERYDRELTDLFELQDEITKAVTVALQVNLTEGDAARIAAEGTRNLQAWEAFLQGKAGLLRFTKLDNFRARRFFEQAVLHDPNYGLALVELANTYWLDARFRHTPDPAASLALAKATLRRAEELLGESGAILFVKGSLALIEGRHDEALEFHRRAADLGPSDAYCAAILGMTQIYIGDFQGAIASLQASLRLSPYGINWATYYLAFAYLWLCDLEQARSSTALYLAREPQEPYAYILSAIVEAAAGRSEAAGDHITTLLAKHPEMTCDDFAHAQFYRDPERLERLLGWLREAGLPDGKGTRYSAR